MATGADANTASQFLLWMRLLEVCHGLAPCRTIL